MTDLNQAVEAARAFLAIAVPESHDVRVEEVELGDDDLPRFITLSFLRPLSEEESWPPPEFSAALHGLAHSFGQALERLNQAPFARAYRRFEVVNGDVRSMTVREFAGA